MKLLTKLIIASAIVTTAKIFSKYISSESISPYYVRKAIKINPKFSKIKVNDLENCFNQALDKMNKILNNDPIDYSKVPEIYNNAKEIIGNIENVKKGNFDNVVVDLFNYIYVIEFYNRGVKLYTGLSK